MTKACSFQDSRTSSGRRASTSFSDGKAKLTSRWRYARRMKNFKLCILCFAVSSHCSRADVHRFPPRSRSVESPLEVPAEPAVDPHYEAIIQRGPDYIDALRAEPAPAQPEVVEGKSELGDQRELASKGYVRIGNGHYARSTSSQCVKRSNSAAASAPIAWLLYPHHADASRKCRCGSVSGRLLRALQAPVRGDVPQPDEQRTRKGSASTMASRSARWSAARRPHRRT